MIPLPNKLRKNGFNYTLIRREGSLCIYEQTYTDKIKYYEVFVAQVSPAKTIFGKEYQQRELFPSNTDFGKTAWSCRTLKNAIERMNEINQHE